MNAYPLVDLDLSRRLERAEAWNCADFVEAHARLSPEAGVEWIDVNGAWAMFDGPESPITQTFGLGMFQPPTASDLDRIEAFFFDRGAPVDHEVSPLAGPSILPLLNDRGYRPFELSSVLYMPLDETLLPPGAPGVEVRVASPAERDVWAQTFARGWSDSADALPSLLEISRISAARPAIPTFLAQIEGRPVAAALLGAHNGVALLAGACTIPDARNRGAQQALLAARLRYAAAAGCNLAMMGAAPGSSSQRNAERQGFRIAYTRIKWRLARR